MIPVLKVTPVVPSFSQESEIGGHKRAGAS